MNIETFIDSRQPRWQRLERLLETIENEPDRALGPERLADLLSLYRATCADLNRARSYTASPELLGHLNALAGRAYRFVYRGSGRRSLRDTLRDLFLVEVPAAFRRERLYVLAAAGALALGALFGGGAVVADPANSERIIPAEFFTESPRERVERLEREDERIDSVESAAAFGAFLYTHNIQVAFLAFALGAMTVVLGYWVLFYNGAILGAVAATYALDGVTVFFLAWVGPHGALEIPAIVFAAAAGLRAGHALYAPGSLSRGSSLRAAFPAVWRMLAGCVLLLVLAGLVEGSFSQYTAKTFPYAVKIAVAALLFLAMIAWLLIGRRRMESSA